MHTDEYEISLSRELAVCKSAIKKIREFLPLWRENTIKPRSNSSKNTIAENSRTTGMITGPGAIIMNRSKDGKSWRGSKKRLSG
jgi:hypothetical protein